MLVLRSPDGVGDAPVPHLLGLGVPLARAILAAHGGQLEELGEEADAMKIVIRFPPSRVMPTGSTVSTAAPYREV